MFAHLLMHRPPIYCTNLVAILIRERERKRESDAIISHQPSELLAAHQSPGSEGAGSEEPATDWRGGRDGQSSKNSDHLMRVAELAVTTAQRLQ
jgi:hypothetical protein